MKNIYLFTFVFLFTSFSVFGQSQIIFDKQDTESFLLKYSPGESNIKKMIFAKIAQGYNKPLSNVSLTFSFKQRRQILKKGNNLEFIVKLNNINIAGDKMYREFNISKKLIPGKTSFTLQWLKGNTIINTYTFNDVPLNGNNVTLVNMTVTDTLQTNGYKIKLVNKKFRYTQQNKQQFDNKVKFIDDYYNENIIARDRLRDLNNINSERDFLIHLENLNDIYIYRDTANSLISYANSVKQKPFYKNLPIDSKDPAGLKAKLLKITNKATVLRNVCNDILENLDQIYYERGIEMLARHKPSKADYFFNKSLEINPTFAPSHFQLARLYYNTGYTDKAVNKIFEIRGMDADQETRMQTVELARGIYSDFLLDAGNLNSQGRFDDAIIILQRARDICRDFPEVNCRPNMDVEMSRAVNGKYDLILNDIDNSLRNNNLQETERIITVALDFANNSRAFIPDNYKVAERISNLYYKYIESANQLSLLKKYDNAVSEYDQASRICNTYQEINCTDELQNGYRNARTGKYDLQIYNAEQIYRSGNSSEAELLIDKAIAYREKYQLNQNTKEDRLFLDIKQSVYNELIETGQSLHSAGKYKDALNSFDRAIQLDKKYVLRTNTNLSKYVKSSAKSLVFNIIDEGNNKVNVNNLKLARQLYSKAKSIVNEYAIDTDNSVSAAVSELKGRIFQQECVNAQNSYNKYYEDALSLLTDKKFISADNKFNDALVHANKFSQCEIDTKELRFKKNNILPAVTYSKKLNAVNNYINKKTYKTAVTEYMSAEAYFESQSVQNFGISHTPLFDFIRSSYTDFIIYSVGFYNHNKEFDKAIDLLKELSRRQVKNKYTSDVQITLGTDLATQDFNQNPGGNYKSNIAQYARGDKFFKYFSKAYKKQWKRLD